MHACVIAVTGLHIVDRAENNTEENKQRRRTKKDWYSRRNVKKYFREEEMINLSSGVDRLGKMSSED